MILISCSFYNLAFTFWFPVVVLLSPSFSIKCTHYTKDDKKTTKNFRQHIILQFVFPFLIIHAKYHKWNQINAHDWLISAIPLTSSQKKWIIVFNPFFLSYAPNRGRGEFFYVLPFPFFFFVLFFGRRTFEIISKKKC